MKTTLHTFKASSFVNNRLQCWSNAMLNDIHDELLGYIEATDEGLSLDEFIRDRCDLYYNHDGNLFEVFFYDDDGPVYRWGLAELEVRHDGHLHSNF
jgi:hypothetical protein